MLWVLLVFVTSFAATLILTPIFIRKLREAGIVGKDIHKEDRPEIPEMGGFVLIFGFSVGLLTAIPFVTDNLAPLFAAFLTVLITGMLGICDDLFGIRQKIKAWLPIFAAIPLMVVQVGVSQMTIPFIGLVDLGIWYVLFIIPLEMAIISNATNMLAGYNGMEAGLGLIACAFLALIGMLTGNIIIVVLMLSMAAACMGFLWFNKYPARVFMGDVGSFTIGAAIASAIIIGNMETIGGIIIGASIINGAVTTIDIIRGKPIQKFSDVKNEILVPPSKKYVQSLYFWIERRRAFTEKKIVCTHWLIGIVFGLAGLVYFLMSA